MGASRPGSEGKDSEKYAKMAGIASGGGVKHIASEYKVKWSVS